MRLIDADEMIKRLQEWNTDDAMDKALYNFTMHRILEQPTIEPERKKGKWIDDGSEFGCCCSECDETLDNYFDGALYEVRMNKIPNFCPNCGAYMKGEQDV